MMSSQLAVPSPENTRWMTEKMNLPVLWWPAVFLSLMLPLLYSLNLACNCKEISETVGSVIGSGRRVTIPAQNR